MMKAARYRAARKGLVFSITRDDIRIPQVCPALGIPLRFRNSTADDSSMSLDRIDNTRGYEPGNVAVISLKANRIKGKWTLTELDAVASWFRSQISSSPESGIAGSSSTPEKLEFSE